MTRAAVSNFQLSQGHRRAVLRKYLVRLVTHRKYSLNLNGHSHNYERSYPQDGIVHVTVGTGGSELEENKTTCLFRICPAPSWSAYRAMHFGVLKLNFGRREIRGEFVCGPAGGGKNDVQCALGTVIDRFTVATGLSNANAHLLLFNRQSEYVNPGLSLEEKSA